MSTSAPPSVTIPSQGEEEHQQQQHHQQHQQEYPSTNTYAHIDGNHNRRDMVGSTHTIYQTPPHHMMSQPPHYASAPHLQHSYTGHPTSSQGYMHPHQMHHPHQAPHPNSAYMHEMYMSPHYRIYPGIDPSSHSQGGMSIAIPPNMTSTQGMSSVTTTNSSMSTSSPNHQQNQPGDAGSSSHPNSSDKPQAMNSHVPQNGNNVNAAYGMYPGMPFEGMYPGMPAHMMRPYGAAGSNSGGASPVMDKNSQTTSPNSVSGSIGGSGSVGGGGSVSSIGGQSYGNYSNHDDENPDEDLHFKILCPQVVIGLIIGKNGTIINLLNESTGARIKLSQNNEHYPNTSDRILILSGPREGLNNAARELVTRIAEAPDKKFNLNATTGTNTSTSNGSGRDGHSGRNDRYTIKVVIPYHASSSVIGKHGSTIKRMTQASGCQFQLGYETDSNITRERIVSISCNTIPGLVMGTHKLMSQLLSDPKIRNYTFLTTNYNAAQHQMYHMNAGPMNAGNFNVPYMVPQYLYPPRTQQIFYGPNGQPFYQMMPSSQTMHMGYMQQPMYPYGGAHLPSSIMQSQDTNPTGVSSAGVVYGTGAPQAIPTALAISQPSESNDSGENGERENETETAN